MELNIEKLADEVSEALSAINVDEEGEHFHSNYQKITAWCLRLTELHNLIALAEIQNEAAPELKKFRTLILDPTIERLEKTAMYESRKITAKALEASLDR